MVGYKSPHLLKIHMHGGRKRKLPSDVWKEQQHHTLLTQLHGSLRDKRAFFMHL
jgi:hypothetical protein